MAGAVFVLVTPDGARVPTLIVVGILAAGSIHFAKMMIFDRDVLDVGAHGGDGVDAVAEPTP